MMVRKNRRNGFLLAVLFLVFLISPISARAADYYVDAVNGSDIVGNGSLANPWKTITKALNTVLTPGNTIHVAPGTYNPALGEIFPLTMRNGVSLVGAGADNTILDAQSTKRVIYSYMIGSNTTIEGFTIKNGYTTGNGGGIYCYNSSLRIANCNIINNQAYGGGGVEFEYYDTSTITNCNISYNKASWGGGIEAYYNSSPTITNCVISHNGGTGMGPYGGGIESGFGSLSKITNCTIVENNAFYGGGIECYSGSAKITNCTISNNNGGLYGGAICLINSGQTEVVNSILWGNTAFYGNEVAGYYCSRFISTIKLNYSDFNPGNVYMPAPMCSWTGSNNINANPLFVGGGDYHITEFSPCIDKGTSDKVTYPYIPNNDIDGDLRPYGAGYDIGSDEYGIACTDNDEDGYYVEEGCGTPVDCDDSDPIEHPNQTWYKDADNDKYSDGTTNTTSCTRPSGYKVASELTATSGDCNDNDSSINPSATEVCNDIDDNCNGEVDEGVLNTYYRDADADTYGNPSVTTQACTQPSGYVTDSTDCDDNDPIEHPNQTWYKDADNDNYSDGTTNTTSCIRPSGYKVASELTATSGDCNENNASINPGATEVCNDIDDNCNGEVDEGVKNTYYRDADGDSYGNPNNSTQACTVPPGYVTDNTDCDDADANIHPNATELCDGLDNNCDSVVPANEADADGDGWMICAGDCDDTNANVNPGAAEICNDGIDNDCNGEDNVTPTVGTITAPTDPIRINESITASAEFTDPNVNDLHTVTWDWGDGTTSEYTLSQGSRFVQDSHTYTVPGVFTIKLTISESNCGSDTEEYRYIVVYDPYGGFVTGGGWINSPAGAYTDDPMLTGKATFGFVSKYKKGATVPTGVTEFQFKVADLNFHSESYEWLVVAGARAQYKGIGTINGEGIYGFMLSAIDGQITGGGGIDNFRIKIWDKISNMIIYDNMLGASDDAVPTTVISGGSIVIHKQ